MDLMCIKKAEDPVKDISFNILLQFQKMRVENPQGVETLQSQSSFTQIALIEMRVNESDGSSERSSALSRSSRSARARWRLITRLTSAACVQAVARSAVSPLNVLPAAACWMWPLPHVCGGLTSDL